MLQQILLHTPIWVWFALPALIWLGMAQTRPRTASLRRITLMPLAMVGLSLYSSATAFAAHPGVMLAWLAGAGAVATWILRRPLPQATRYDGATQEFSIPASWTPLALILAIFVCKYIVGALSATQPAVANGLGFGLLLATLFGGFSGAFVARAARLWRLADQTRTTNKLNQPATATHSPCAVRTASMLELARGANH